MTVAPLPQNLEEYTAAVFAELTKRGYTVGPHEQNHTLSGPTAPPSP
jgi:hypothetical protein